MRSQYSQDLSNITTWHCIRRSKFSLFSIQPPSYSLSFLYPLLHKFLIFCNLRFISMSVTLPLGQSYRKLHLKWWRQCLLTPLRSWNKSDCSALDFVHPLVPKLPVHPACPACNGCHGNLQTSHNSVYTKYIWWTNILIYKCWSFMYITWHTQLIRSLLFCGSCKGCLIWCAITSLSFSNWNLSTINPTLYMFWSMIKPSPKTIHTQMCGHRRYRHELRPY